MIGKQRSPNHAHHVFIAAMIAMAIVTKALFHKKRLNDGQANFKAMLIKQKGTASYRSER